MFLIYLNATLKIANFIAPFEIETFIAKYKCREEFMR